MTTTTQTPRQQARAIAGVLDGHAPAELTFVVTDLIEIAIEDTATEVERERNDLRQRLGEQQATTDRVRVERGEALGRVMELERQLWAAAKELSEARAEVERLRAQAAAAEDAMRYVNHHLTHGGLYGPWSEFAKQRVRAALTLFSDPTKEPTHD